MADNKNQHYVPRCHLKPFTLDGEGLAINLFNHRSNKIIFDAPVKNQCSRNYFYGQDLILEKFLQKWEGRYATVIKKIVSDEQITDVEKIFLRDFAYLQWSRTAAAVNRRMDAINEMDDIAFKGFNDPNKIAIDASHERVMFSVMKTWSETIKNISDLSVILIKNMTDVDFITSDDPSIMSNRVYLQRMGDSNFGVNSTGVQIIMPLTPRMAIIVFDPTAYLAKNVKRGIFYANKLSDVRLINEYQIINSVSNLYFLNKTDDEKVRLEFQKHKDRRLAHRFHHWIGIMVDHNGDQNIECYRRIGENDLNDRSTRIIAHSPIYPKPSGWFSGLPFRLPLRGVYTGSASAFIRPMHLPSGVRYKVLDIPNKPMPGFAMGDREYVYRRKDFSR